MRGNKYSGMFNTLGDMKAPHQPTRRHKNRALDPNGGSSRNFALYLIFDLHLQNGVQTPPIF